MAPGLAKLLPGASADIQEPAIAAAAAAEAPERAAHGRGYRAAVAARHSALRALAQGCEPLSDDEAEAAAEAGFAEPVAYHLQVEVTWRGFLHYAASLPLTAFVGWDAFMLPMAAMAVAASAPSATGERADEALLTALASTNDAQSVIDLLTELRLTVLITRSDGALAAICDGVAPADSRFVPRGAAHPEYLNQYRAPPELGGPDDVGDDLRLQFDISSAGLSRQGFLLEMYEDADGEEVDGHGVGPIAAAPATEPQRVGVGGRFLLFAGAAHHPLHATSVGRRGELQLLPEELWPQTSDEATEDESRQVEIATALCRRLRFYSGATATGRSSPRQQ